MNSNTAIQLSDEFEAALSEILPNLYQLLQSYQISTTLQIVLDIPSSGCRPIEQCISCNGALYCYPHMPPPPCPKPKPWDVPELDLGPEKLQQFSTDVASELSRLSQPVQQTDESFEIHILIDPATESNSLSCRFVDDALLCTDQPQ